MLKKLKPQPTSAGRRGFLKGAAAGAAVIVTPAARAQQPPRGNATAPVPSNAALAAEAGQRPPAPRMQVIERPGSDYMVDVLKTLNLPYVCSNPGSTFESLHESLINYGQNKTPEFLTCCHEESAVAMAQGYAKIKAEPLMVLLHGTVGLMHASMAIYNAYADRVPVFLVVGNHVDGAERGAGVESQHSAQDIAALVRDFVKWDDAPYSLGHFAESAVRAYNIAMTPPMGPVLLVAPHELQSEAMTGPGPRIPKLTRTSPPRGDMSAINDAAKMLVAAERPAIVAARAAKGQAGQKLVVELAELLEAPVSSSERINIPNRHPLAGNGGPGYQPDVTLNLEVADASGSARAARARGAKVINISSVTYSHKSNIQDFGKYAEVDLDSAADAEATLPTLIEACRKLLTADRRAAIAERGKKVREAHLRALQNGIDQGSYGWDASPIALSRLCAELWPLIKNEDWALVSWDGFISNWPMRLWNFEKTYQYVGGRGAAGIGGGIGAAVGASLANRAEGRLCINIQTDGDLNYAPAVLWTAAHHKIPMLTIMHNNRGYHAETMLVSQQCSLHNREDKAYIGTKLWEPNIDYKKLGEAYGLYAEGPITDPKELAGAYRRGIERVKAGQPALIDVITQPR
jgi:thiamine pyrophosphate-dependent acetolactate synthase large subunit-like protein